MKISTTRNNQSNEKKHIIISTIILLVAWAVSAYVVDMELKLPSPLRTIEAILTIVQSKWFWQSVAATIIRLIQVFALSMLGGMSLGFIAGFFPVIDHLLKPIILLVRSTPTVVVILLAFIWIGQEKSPVLVGFMVIFPIVYSNILSGLRNVDEKLVEMGHLYKFDAQKMIRHIYIPSIEPYVRAAMSSAIGLNMKIMIAAEVICQPRFGVGTQLQQERMLANIPELIAWGIIAIVLVAVIEKLVSIVKPKRINQSV